MSTLDFNQRIDLTEYLADALSHEDPERGYPEDVALEVVDSWLPVYYYDIVQQWQDARAPEVEDTGLLDPNRIGDVYHVMTVALWEQANQWTYDLWRDYYDGEVLTAGQALEACNTYLTVKNRRPYTRNGMRAEFVTV